MSKNGNTTFVRTGKFRVQLYGDWVKTRTDWAIRTQYIFVLTGIFLPDVLVQTFGSG
jgi:hypothetical protein